MLKKILLAATLMSASTLAVAQLQVTSAGYDKNVLAVINATNVAVDIVVDGDAIQLSDSNYITPCTTNAQVTVVAAGFDEEISCPAFVTIEETE